jgi:hypothetical protein
MRSGVGAFWNGSRLALCRLLDFLFLLVVLALLEEFDELDEFEDDFAVLDCWGRAAAIIEQEPASIASVNNCAMDSVLIIPPALVLHRQIRVRSRTYHLGVHIMKISDPGSSCNILRGAYRTPQELNRHLDAKNHSVVSPSRKLRLDYGSRGAWQCGYTAPDWPLKNMSDPRSNHSNVPTPVFLRHGRDSARQK